MTSVFGPGAIKGMAKILPSFIYMKVVVPQFALWKRGNA
jgi:hypothetical protein